MTREKRQYSDDEVASALARLRANNGNAKRTAAQLGINRTTLRGWAGRHSNKTGTSKHVPEQAIEAKGAEQANRFDEITDRLTEKILNAISSVPVETATDIRNLLVGAGITTEKASFSRGGPNSRVESVKVSLIDPSALKSQGLTVIEGGRKAS